MYNSRLKVNLWFGDISDVIIDVIIDPSHFWWPFLLFGLTIFESAVDPTFGIKHTTWQQSKTLVKTIVSTLLTKSSIDRQMSTLKKKKTCCPINFFSSDSSFLGSYVRIRWLLESKKSIIRQSTGWEIFWLYFSAKIII